MAKTALGILGLGVRSTLFYLKELNRLYNQHKGGYSTCPYILLNTDFHAINSLLPHSSAQLDAVVQQYIQDIEKLDIERLLIPNITLHETIDRLLDAKKIIHPIHLAIAKVKQKNWSKVVLFGSLHSMQAPYISAHFQSNGIEIELPSTKDMLLIDEIRKQIYAETETAELIEDYHLLIKKYNKEFPIVLACTELSILKPDSNPMLLDMADIQIAEALQEH